MLLEINDAYDCCWNFIWSLCLPINCEKSSHEMQQISQGLTDYKWYKDYYCPTCKITIVKMDKEQNNNNHKITERNF